jgi:hypothetical protein
MAEPACSWPRRSLPAFHDGKQLWFGSERNIGQRLRMMAEELDIEIRVAT